MLAAVGGAGVGDDDANALLRDAERGGELFADAEGALGAGPDGELVGVLMPFGDGGARLERGVGNVLDGVGLGELDVGGGEGFVDASLDAGLRALVGRGLGVRLEVLEDGRVGGLAGLLGPLRAGGESVDRALGRVGIRRDETDELAVLDDFDAGE